MPIMIEEENDQDDDLILEREREEASEEIKELEEEIQDAMIEEKLKEDENDVMIVKRYALTKHVVIPSFNFLNCFVKFCFFKGLSTTRLPVLGSEMISTSSNSPELRWSNIIS